MHPTVILFDLGGVLLDVVSARRLSTLMEERLPIEEVARRWTQSKYLKLFESGQCGSMAFAAGVMEELGLHMPAEAFLAEFERFIAGFYPGAPALLKAIPGSYTMACLTDTNEIQWRSLCARVSIDRYFKHTFLSYEIGHMKPNPQVYAHVIQKLGCAPGQILYLDDNPANVEAGREAGMQAQRTVGLSEVRAALEGAGILLTDHL